MKDNHLKTSIMNSLRFVNIILIEYVTNVKTIKKFEQDMVLEARIQ